MATRKKPETIVNCPQCGKPAVWSATQQFRPFCCERCKLIDLGDWAIGNHKIPGEPCDDSNANEEVG